MTRISGTFSPSRVALGAGAYPPDAHCRVNSPAADPRLSLAGEAGLPWFDQNVWGPVAGEVCTSTVWNLHNWQFTASMNNGSGSVTCFPNTAGYPLSWPWNSKSYLISGVSENMPVNAAIVASACWDNFFDNTLVGPTGFAVNEVMFHFDYRRRGGGPFIYTGIPFGGSVINGVSIPRTYWSMTTTSTTCYWQQTDASGNLVSTPTMTVDALAMFRYLISGGYLSSSCNMTGFGPGFEVCDTGGSPFTFTYYDLWWQGALRIEGKGTMTRIMGDSAAGPAAIPLTVNIAAYYTDGHIGVETPAEVQQRFPHAKYGWCSIDVTGAAPWASVRDWETGDKGGSLEQWVIDHNAHSGKKDAYVYCNVSTLPEVRQLTGSQILGRDYWLWIATLDGRVIAPGPVHLDAAPYTYPGVGACQVKGAALTGGDWDMSLVYDGSVWLPVAPPKPPPPHPLVSKGQAEQALAELVAYLAQG